MRLNRFAGYAWLVLIYNLGVIAWGAYVRATGSGAGCGRHWPACNGEVIPRNPSTEMLVEFSHRLSSGLVLLAVGVLLIWAWRAYPKGHPVRLGAVLSAAFTVSEALLGAGLVLFGLVAENASVARAVVVPLHLVNTFFLLASITLTALWTSGGRRLSLKGQGPAPWFLGVGLVAMLVLGASGAVTALGDTLFPAGSLGEGIRQDFLPTAHFLIRLRVLHPVIAVATGFYALGVAGWLRSNRSDPTIRRFAWAVTALVIIQLLAGAVNLVLLAPVWMQMVHLLLADLLWVSFVLLTASVLVPHPAGEPSPATSAAKMAKPPVPEQT